jgi:uncharacterized membrane protein HdeD (DUF308 family)
LDFVPRCRVTGHLLSAAARQTRRRAEALALVIALWALFDGIVNIVHAFDLRGVAPHWWGMLLAGVIGVVFGVLALYYYPFLSLSFAVALASLWMLMAGIVGVYIAVQERRSGIRWGWTMTFGIVALAAGIAAFMNPGPTLAMLMLSLAWFGIIGGIAILMGAGRTQPAEQDLTHAMHA